MFLRILVVLFWILAALAPTSAQTSRRRAQKPSPAKAPVTRADKVPADDSELSKPRLLQSDLKGWVYVSYTIDLARQLGEENIYTLDGGPAPVMKKPRTTIGLVIDNEGHVVLDLPMSRQPIRRSAFLFAHHAATRPPQNFSGWMRPLGCALLRSRDSNSPLPLSPI